MAVFIPKSLSLLFSSPQTQTQSYHGGLQENYLTSACLLLMPHPKARPCLL